MTTVSKTRLALLLTASHALGMAAVWWHLAHGRTAPLPPPPIASATAGPAAGATGTNSATSAPAPPAATATVRSQPFHWSQVESSDYRKYIANLRAIGCPEETIKDFIMTDLMRHYARRRGELRDNGREFRYWETDERRALTAKQRAERERELAQIDKELPAVLRELLGVNYERELSRYFVDDRADEKRLVFLDDAKRGQVLVVRELVEEMRERLLEQIGPDGPTPEQQARLRAINELHHGLLSQTLSAEELRLYQLSTSPTADRLRSQLVGFAPTEEEFRFLFELWERYDREFEFAGPERQADREAAQRRIEEQILARLGPERAADYQRTRRPEYREVVLFTQEHELPAATAQAIDEMRAAALHVRAQVLADRQLDATQRAAALQALQEEVQSSLGAVLGGELLGKFTSQAGRWISTLAAGANPPAR
jgi:hypothetical protein